MQARELAKQIKSGKAPCVVDVRSGPEYRSGHIPGAVHVPFWSVLLRRKGLPKEKDALIVLACEHGPRAELARAMLALSGRCRLELLDGNMNGWRRAGLPVRK